MAKKSKAKVFDNADVLPTPERGQHNQIETLETRKAGKLVRRVVDGTSLDYYRRHGTITPNGTTPGCASMAASWLRTGNHVPPV